MDPSLNFIEIILPSDSRVEQMISIEDIIKPIIPHTTVDIIKFQKYDSYFHQDQSQPNNQTSLDYSIFQTNGNFSDLVKAGIINKNSELYRQK